MSKDGEGNCGSGSSCKCSSSCGSKSADQADIFDLHIQVIKSIDEEMQRLHELIQRGDGNEDVSQDQLDDLHQELIRLSISFSHKECE